MNDISWSLYSLQYIWSTFFDNLFEYSVRFVLLVTFTWNFFRGYHVWVLDFLCIAILAVWFSGSWNCWIDLVILMLMLKECFVTYSSKLMLSEEEGISFWASQMLIDLSFKCIICFCFVRTSYFHVRLLAIKIALFQLLRQNFKLYELQNVWWESIFSLFCYIFLLIIFLYVII